MGYYKEALKGISWMGILRGLTRGLALIKIAILARILSPLQFGIFGIATLVLGFLEIMTETGINIFLIQKKDNIDRYINSAWFISIIRGFLIGFLIFLLSPVIANYFESESAVYIIRLISLVPIIRGFINPSCVKFQKNLEFRKQFFYESSIFGLDFLLTVIIALITKSENSLVLGMIFSTILEIVLSHKIFSPRPKFVFEKEKTLEVINRGKWITGAGVFNYLFQNIDDLFVGKMMGATSLGVYQQAYKLSTVPVSEVGEVFNKVTFPIYTKIEGDKVRLRKAFFKTLLVICLFVVPFVIILFKYPVEIVKIVYGDKWLSMVPVLQILAIFGLIKSIFNSFFSLFLGLKKQEVVTLITFIGSALLFFLTFPLIKIFGVIGAGYATIIATLLAYPFVIYYFFKLTK